MYYVLVLVKLFSLIGFATKNGLSSWSKLINIAHFQHAMYMQFMYLCIVIDDIKIMPNVKSGVVHLFIVFLVIELKKQSN